MTKKDNHEVPLSPDIHRETAGAQKKSSHIEPAREKE